MLNIYLLVIHKFGVRLGGNSDFISKYPINSFNISFSCLPFISNTFNFFIFPYIFSKQRKNINKHPRSILFAGKSQKQTWIFNGLYYVRRRPLYVSKVDNHQSNFVCEVESITKLAFQGLDNSKCFVFAWIQIKNLIVNIKLVYKAQPEPLPIKINKWL